MKSLAVLTILSIVCFTGIGCSMTPAQLQTDVAEATALLLNGAIILDPSEKPNILKDATTLANTNNLVVIRQFFPGANSGQLASATITQAITLLGSKLSGSPTGNKITEIIGIAEIPLIAVLGGMDSPIALLSPANQALALAFFSALSQAVAKVTGNASLNPPVPPAAPAPTPAPTPSPPTSAPSK